MPGPLPDSYRRLAAFASRLKPGVRLYDQGTVPDRFFVVLSGEILFEAVSETGEATVVAQAPPGALVGHVAAFSGRPTSAAARVDRESVVLAIPVSRLADAIREAPELGVQLVHAFASTGQHRSHDDAPAGAAAGLTEVALPAEPEAGPPPPPRPAPDDDEVLVEGEFDEAQFFVDTVTCPVSGTRFQYLRVRTRAVRPTGRSSDFHVEYGDVNPTWYGVVVCPACRYAAYHDDFAKPGDAAIRARLWDGREDRQAMASGPLNGVRVHADAVAALMLAMNCYEVRATSDSRTALLLHRRAWLEREAGNDAEERAWLQRAKDAYERAYESDGTLAEDAAVRIAYLVGDLAFRLGDLHESAQWLETAVRAGPLATAGMVRTARDRLQDMRDLIKRERIAS